MNSFKVLIIEDEVITSTSLASMLKRLGHYVVGRAKDRKETLRKVKVLDPDIILMDIGMPNMDGLETAKEILSIKQIPIIILTDYSQHDFIEKAGVLYYLIKPITEKDLIPCMSLAVSRFRELQALQKEVRDLKEALRTRKLIEQAKGLIMEREGLNETQAFRKIQKKSRDSNIPMAKIAESIIIASRILN